MDGGDQPIMALRVAIEHLVIADDLIQARLALEGVQFLEHAQIVARALHAMNHQFLAADAQAAHLDGAVDDGKEQRRSDDGEADQHQSAQRFWTGQSHPTHSSSESTLNERTDRTCRINRHE